MTRPDDRPDGGLLVAAGAGLLVVLCCGLPLILAGGALAWTGRLLRSPWARDVQCYACCCDPRMIRRNAANITYTSGLDFWLRRLQV